MLTVVFGCALCSVADVGELFLGVGTSYNIIEELAVNGETHGQWKLCRFFLCVRQSKTKETEQLRSLMTGNDFVNFITTEIV